MPVMFSSVLILQYIHNYIIKIYDFHYVKQTYTYLKLLGFSMYGWPKVLRL